MFYLMMHSTHFIYNHTTVKDHGDSKRGNLLLLIHGYSFQLAARYLLYAPSNRQDRTYHSFCYTSHGALVTTSSSSMDLQRGINRTTDHRCSTMELHLAPSPDQMPVTNIGSDSTLPLVMELKSN